MIKGKKRVVAKRYTPHGGILYALQVYERNLKAWVSVGCTTDPTYAASWA